jgi:5-methylcytosine-specific restriction endonuclease McrBC GTP-binding regulatory subunit McrB
MEREVNLAEVQTFETRRGGQRFVARDADGNEYTTFREDIGARAKQLEGRRVRIEFHETQRGEYLNVYLDAIEPLEEPAADAAPSPAEADEAGWRTAVEAAPWLVGESEPHEEVPPDELYEKLRPFKERVARDIEEGGEDAEEPD